MNLSTTDNAIQAEQSVLGAVFIDPQVMDDITFLESRDFLTDQHQKIYEVMKYLDSRSKPIDLTTVTAEYQKYGRMDESGGVSYLTDLAGSVPSTANTIHYARIVRSAAHKRRGADIGAQIIALTDQDFESDEDYFSAAESLVQQMRPIEEGRMKNFAETRDDYMIYLQKDALGDFIKTGFNKFDAWSNGIARGWLFVSAGRPSVGKTAMLLQRVYGVAKQDAGPVLIYSQEMGENQLKDRIVSAVTGIPLNRIKNKNLESYDLQKISDLYDELEKLPIFIQDSAGVSMDTVRATAKRFKRKHGKVAMIAVDYLQIMSIPQAKGELRTTAIGKVTSAAKQLARDIDCCFMMLSQMTRDSDKTKVNLSYLTSRNHLQLSRMRTWLSSFGVMTTTLTLLDPSCNSSSQKDEM
ncbi:replicative DNA helicase [Geomicrobium sp. JCM 19037]|nr:replicative DNA helicase [Geomicrobium sp. JCM 19037]